MEEHYAKTVKLPEKVWPNAESAICKGALLPAVENAIELWEKAKGLPSGSVANVLQWDGIMGCYCFIWASMFVGVETDGYIHT